VTNSNYIIGVLALGGICALPACDRPGGPGVTDEFGDAGVVFIGGIRCPAAASAVPLPARSSVTMPSGAPTGDVFFTNVLYDRFRSICGGCHVDGNSGGYVVTKGTFGMQVTQTVVDKYIKSDDPMVYMPPVGSPNAEPYDQRDATDPVVELAALLQIWIQQGSPPSSFDLNPAGGPDGSAGDGSAPAAPTASPGSRADYSLTPELGSQMTNIGTCIPSKYVVGLDTSTMDQLDGFFADATELPKTLGETDLTTLDSDELARNGVISYYPAYPAWSDDAGIMRYVRVPRDQPITFDEEKQQFLIPANTRFYQTFLKHVIDASGNDAFRKMETRVIVSRPDEDLPDGTVNQTALFGTYLWDESETTATLLQDPLRSGEPFADRLVSYVTDEPRAAAIVASKPPNVDYVLEYENPGLVRHYAIPGRDRCHDCHMGSPSASFVDGFTPLQLLSLPAGTSGVIEPAAGDQLTQLRRLIDYKVISGMTSPADVTPLEDSQLPRTARNDYELRAQAYMLGNCAHCHNPRGDPSVSQPELKPVLNFLPGPDGGIFQFPFAATSPIRQRGVLQNVPIPYITPSLRDYPSTSPNTTYTPKYVKCVEDEQDGWCVTPGQVVDFIDAPWRSIIYRNVDTPFDYVDDLAIFSQMPLNTPGVDCRITQILGDWMVSIPAAPANAKADPDAIPGVTKGTVDDTAIPLLEVKPGDAGYADALAKAQDRLAAYHAGHRYNYCPDTTDIVDPAVLNRSRPTDPLTPTDRDQYDPNDVTRLIMLRDGVPDRPHWAVTDASDPPGDWTPRRPDWATALVQHTATNTSLTTPAELADLQQVVDDLPKVALTDSVRQALTTELPFGLWLPKSGCNFTGIPTVRDFQGASRPLWMGIASPPPDPSAPVYMQSAGAAVFTNICVNCHGPEADASGLLADEILTMTGGDARMSDFRAGLFGPEDAVGANLQRVFSPPAVIEGTGSPEDYGARYMSWMALGGTQKQIPPQLLTIVATTAVLGQERSFTTPGSPNMLELAQQLCTHVLPADVNVEEPTLDFLLYRRGFLDLTGTTTDVIGKNGDMELWLRLCALDNRPVVRVVLPAGGGKWGPTTAASSLSVQRTLSLFWGDAYPAGAPVMDHHGRVVAGLTPDNLFPLCLRRPSDPTEAGYADAFRTANPVGGSGGAPIPYCPDELFATTTNTAGEVIPAYRLAYSYDPVTHQNVYTDANDWGIRGAINAGLAVFLYVEQLASGATTPKPAYTECELIGAAPGP
jgi:mono/diheme cytochrome c family protein